MGWEVVEEDRLTPELRALRKREGAVGLDIRPRQAMEKNLTRVDRRAYNREQGQQAVRQEEWGAVGLLERLVG